MNPRATITFDGILGVPEPNPAPKHDLLDAGMITLQADFNHIDPPPSRRSSNARISRVESTNEAIAAQLVDGRVISVASGVVVGII